ncbi:MAG: cryptochrome/photolyase family protein [Bacteroidota bacterium]
MKKVSIFWLRRDLRLNDNHALHEALRSGYPVLPVFVFDTDILDELPPDDARLNLIHQELNKLHKKLRAKGSGILVYHGKPLDAFHDIMQSYNVMDVYANEDYEPYAISRDNGIKNFLQEKHVDFHLYTDQLIMHPDAVLKDDKTPYRVFTPYMKAWRRVYTPDKLKPYPSENAEGDFADVNKAFPSLESMGYKTKSVELPEPIFSEEQLRQYAEKRDLPAEEGTSRLSVHLRFGLLSIRQIFRDSWHISDVFANELIWREFYMMILYHFPEVVDKAFKPKYDNIRWRNNEKEFERWCQGKTGFPIVDAGMRQLNETGYMHNRLRMITASFLVKDLLIDWRRGESYFAEKLLDYELSSNNGGWQWAAGSGCDATPYFRIFNPDSQQKKFDPDMAYIRRWVPEIDSADYPEPMLDHKEARERALEVYKEGLGR